MERPSWAPAQVDVDRPSVARIYDAFLGGSHNFAVDREVAAQATAHMPELPFLARENRNLLRRVVRMLAGPLGVRQFLDLGSGIPTVGNVHEIAHQIDDSCRIVYVDIDPIAILHARSILDGDPRVEAVQADLRRPLEILGDPAVRGLLDFSRPVAVLLVAALHFIPDSDDPAGFLAGLRGALPSGSWLAISHASNEDGRRAGHAEAQEVYARRANPVFLRPKAEIAAFFGDWELVDPGVERMPLWHPDDDPEPAAATYPGFAGLARKP
jgi:hypothetical protein